MKMFETLLEAKEDGRRWGSCSVWYNEGDNNFELNIYDFKDKKELFEAIDELVNEFKKGYE